MTTTAFANSPPSTPQTKDPTPADWMAFAQAMGWSIAAMSTGRPVKFITSTGEEVHVTNAMRGEIMEALRRANAGGIEF